MKILVDNWYQKNKEKIREHRKQYRQNNPNITLKAQIKYLKKLDIPYKLGHWNFQRVLISWAKLIKKNDNNQCIICGSKKNIHSHHIFEKSKYPQLSLNPNNGVTLCTLHHHQVHGRKLNPYLEVRK